MDVVLVVLSLERLASLGVPDGIHERGSAARHDDHEPCME